MNLIVKNILFIRLAIGIACFTFILVFIPRVLRGLFEGDQSKITEAVGDAPKQLDRIKREETYQELSPDRSKKISRYEISNDPSLFANSYVTYLDNNIIIAVTNNFGDTQRESYLFVGEYRTGEPHWLGNGYVFFTSHCGSSCRGLSLLDVRTGQRWSAVLSFLSIDRNRPITHFYDWFKQDFEFNGGVKKIRGVFEDNRPYLIFDMENDRGVETGEKRFLFTGSSLILEN